MPRAYINAIDDAPPDLAEMVGYFQGLPLEALASCWVACVVDAACEHAFSAGDIARTLNVVASRLHGVTFDHPPAGLPPKGLPVEQARKQGQEFAIQTGPPPIAKRGGNMDALDQAIDALDPRQWVLVPKSKLSRASCNNRVAKAKKRLGREDIRCFSTQDGDTVIIREELPTK